MRIPKELELVGITVKIKFDNKKCDVHGAYGLANYRDYRILLCDKSDGEVVSREVIEQTFWHELIHLILHSMEERDFKKDERFVSGIADRIHQALKTAKY